MLAAGDGIVVEVQQENTLTGIAVSNLFKWNSVMIQLDEHTAEAGGAEGRGGPLFVEYVHIEAGSCCVRPGDRVAAGQQICRSGSVGFSPEPHLHFTAFRSKDPSAPTVRVRLKGEGGGYIPVAGSWYNSTGFVAREGAGATVGVDGGDYDSGG